MKQIIWLMTGLLLGWLSLAANPAATAPLPTQWVNDPLVRYSPNPDHPLHNSLGFRGPEPQESARRTIVVLGDSGSYVSSPGGYVELLHDEYAAQGCDILNASVQAYDIVQMYGRFERDVLPLQPDAVILSPLGGQWARWQPALGEDVLRLTLDRFAASAAAHDIPLVVLALPVTRTIEGVPLPRAAWDELSDEPTRVAYLETLRVVLLSTDIPSFDGRAAARWTADDYVDGSHLSQQGHQKLADWLDKELIYDLCGEAGN